MDFAEAFLQGFRSELRKMAALPSLSQLMGSSSALGGVGAGLGAAVGGATGALKSYRHAREEGASRGQALLGTVPGALTHAGTGAVLGAGAGLLSGAGASLLSPEKAEALRKSLTQRSAFARAGQRQAHGFTGYNPNKLNPKEGLKELRLESWDRAQAVDAAKDRLKHVQQNPDTKAGLIDRIMGRSAEQGAQKTLERAEKAHRASEVAEDLGLTSLPGAAKAFLNPKTTGKALKASIGNMVHGQSPTSLALGVGLPAAGLVNAIRKPPPEGETKAEAIGHQAGNLAGNALFAPMTMGPQMVLGLGTGALGRRVGKLISRKKTQEEAP